MIAKIILAVLSLVFPIAAALRLRCDSGRLALVSKAWQLVRGIFAMWIIWPSQQYTRGFSRFVTSTSAPVATGWNEHRLGTAQAKFRQKHCRDVLRLGRQRERAAAAEYLCLLQQGIRLFLVAAQVRRQKRWLVATG